MPFIAHIEEDGREILGGFVGAMRSIKKKVENRPALLKDALHRLPVGQLDHARAAPNLELAWKPVYG